MENDTIRSSGSNTLVDVWVDGKMRAISITRAAIEAFLGSATPPQMSGDDRCEFVRKHLPQVVAAVQTRLRSGEPVAGTISIEFGQLGAAGERRKGERRKTSRPAASLPHGERRRGERRKRSQPKD